MLVYVDLPMKSGIFTSQLRLIEADSDPRLTEQIFLCNPDNESHQPYHKLLKFQFEHEQ